MTTEQRLLSGTRRVMTGATGFVGSHFALRRLEANNSPILLVRGSSQQLARERVDGALASAEQTLGARVTLGERSPLVLAADLALADCGMSAESVARLRRAEPAEFWHFAASLRYEEKHRAEIFATNLEGTKHALALARASGCESFVYVSTAYAAGRKSGPITERLHDFSAGHNNAYEESKARAEHVVFDFCARERMRCVILRPSIVIGPYASKTTGGSNTGFYGFLRELSRITVALRALGRPIEICGDPGTLCNLIPVDWLIDDIEASIQRGFQDGSVEHNTAKYPLTIEQVGQVVAAALDIPGFTIDPAVTPRTLLEQQLARRTTFYGSYFSNSKSFIRERGGGRELTATDLADFVLGFLQELTPENAGTPSPARPRTRSSGFLRAPRSTAS
jgi:nucleoside-diphosphate-sugar epimerase